MKLQTLAAACAAIVTVSFAGSALADGASVIAKLQSPVATKTKFIAGGAVFQCEGDTCIAAAPTSQTLAGSTCKNVAKTVGAVVSFGDAERQFDASRLGACNLGSDTQVAKR